MNNWRHLIDETDTDSPIQWQRDIIDVRASQNGYEVCVSGPTYAVRVGVSPNLESAIRTATYLAKYPRQAKAYAGL